MNRYCFVIEINEDQMDDYVQLHKNPWPETLKGLKDAGAKELLIYRYKNFSILFYECEDINEVYRKWGANETCPKWNAGSPRRTRYLPASTVPGCGYAREDFRPQPTACRKAGTILRNPQKTLFRGFRRRAFFNRPY
jgi:L-rhamnose mutarotase